MTEVLLAPYLDIGARVMRIGVWEAIPATALDRTHASSDVALEQAKGLLELYHRSRRVRQGYGVFFRRRGRSVGDPFTMRNVGALRRAMLVAVVEMNPSDVANDDTLNAAHAISTSDNVRVIGHRIDANGYVAAMYGSLTQAWVGGIRVGDEHSEIAPPIEVPFPMLGRPPQEDYTDALYDVLTRDTDEVRRLTAAIDWFDLAWRNSPSVSHDMRIVMLKSAFESLFDVGDRVDDQRRALSQLLDPPNARRRVHHFTTLRGSPVQAEMTDLEWWYTRFAFLRNAIAHGDRPRRRDLRHGRHWHMWIAEYRMRQAIKEVVAMNGHPLVRLDWFNRSVMRAIQRSARGN